MKFPRKLLPLCAGFLLSGLFASVSVLAANAKKPPAAAAVSAVQHLPGYMIVAANLADADYMACVKAHTKFPPVQNAVNNVRAALDCQNSDD